ncbi:RICIN domain-containing protein [Streptomyces sp. NPDC002156]
MPAAAAIAGALLLSVPFLVSNRNDDDTQVSTASGDSTTDTLLGDTLDGATPSAFGTAEPTPDTKKATPSKQASPSPTPTGGKGTAGGAAGNSSAKGQSTGSGSGSNPSKNSSGSKSGTGSGSKSGTGSGSKSGTGSGSKSKTSGSSSSNSGTSSAKTTAPAVVPKAIIFSHASGKCIDVVGDKGKNGAPLEIWSCNGKAQQKWTAR